MTLLRGRLASVAVAAALIGGAAAPAVVLAPVAAAHSVLISVDPEDGAELADSPGQIVLTFNEEINQNFASVAVTAGDDRTNRVVGEPTAAGETVTARVEELEPGSYTVGYRVTSADGHVVTGSSVFTVAAGAGDAGDAVADAGSGGADAGFGGADATGAGATGGDATGGAASQGDGAESEPGSDTEADIADETSGEDSGMNPAIWVVGGLAVLLIGGAFVLLRRGS